MGTNMWGALIPVCRLSEKLSKQITAAELLGGRTETHSKPRAVRSQVHPGSTQGPPCGPCPHVTVCKPHLERHPQSQGQAWVSTALICDILEARILTHLLPPRPPAQGSTDGAPEIILMKPSGSLKTSANPLLQRVHTQAGPRRLF